MRKRRGREDEDVNDMTELKDETGYDWCKEERHRGIRQRVDKDGKERERETKKLANENIKREIISIED